jgi:putative DNA primase/helicase
MTTATSTAARPPKTEPPPSDHIPGLLAHHHEQLRASGLTDATIKAAGIYSETSPTKLSAILGWTKSAKKIAPAIVIPFTNDEGVNGYYRVRPDRPRLSGGKRVKYESPRGITNRAYIPPGVAEKLQDPTCELLITEGEKKALAATQFGFPCIGLVGVYGWQPKCQKRLLPELERTAWRGRQVRIAYDSDINEKPEVQLPESELAKHLQDRGAIVKCVRFPAGPADATGKAAKVGLDDFLVAHGPGELRKLLDTAQEPGELPPEAVLLPAQNMEPATEAKAFLAAAEKDGVCRLRFYRGCFHYWTGGRWVELEPSETDAEIVKHLNHNYRHLTTSIKGNMLMQVKAQSALSSRTEAPCWLGEPPKTWKPSEVLAMKDSLIHLPGLVANESDYSLPATPRYFSPTALNYSFSINAPRPDLWLEFLAQLFGDDGGSVDLLQTWFGYCLTNDTSLQKIMLLIGPPRSGKGTIARVLQSLIGPENCCGPTLASFAGGFGLQPLLGKSLAIIADARLSGKTDQSVVTERLLSISGEDPLTIDRKFREGVYGKLPTRLMIVSNELPRLSESSGALANRMLVLRLTESFLGREDRQLTEKLTEELPGILLWAIAGWQRLNDQGHFVQPDSGTELSNELKDLCSPVGQFVREKCEVEPGRHIRAEDLYSAWTDWCKANGRDYPGTTQTFGRDLRAVLPDLRTSSRREGSSRIRVYEGIDLQGF